jgi:hypothetical protein
MDQPVVYRIRVRGHLSPQWAVWFEGLSMEATEGDTTLTGPLADQSALHGVLARVRDLGLDLVSVAIDPDATPHPDKEQ